MTPAARLVLTIEPVDPPVDLATLSPQARKVLDPASPAAMRAMAAKGIVPGVKPSEAVTIVAVLAESADETVAAAARTTLEKLPAPLLNGALAGDLHPGVLAVLAPFYANNAVVMEKIIAHPALPAAAVVVVAAMANESVAELVAVNEERLIAHPQIIEKLYMNKATRMSTADRVLELAVRHKLDLTGIPAYREAALAIGQELISEPTPEPTPDDLLFAEVVALAKHLKLDADVEDTHRRDEETGEEVVDDKFLPLHARIAKMTPSQKIRTAQVGDAAERLYLVRDNNRLVATAAVRNPSIQENEVVRITASRQVCEDVLRIIANDREWTRSHQIKLNLVQNPRTPFAFAAKLIPHLREHELKAIAKSKNVQGAVVSAARQQLARRNPNA
jgi:hypothetical protein